MGRLAEIRTTLGMRRGAAAVVLMAVLAGAASVALAAGRAGPPGASDGPLALDADQVELIDSENRTIWKGNVVAVQNGARMTTPLLNVYHGRGSEGSQTSSRPVDRMEADGPVYYTTAEQTARGDHATYTAANETVVMTGNVVLVQGKNVMQGTRLVIETRSGKATWDRGRVRGVFYPSDNNAPAAQPKAAQPAAPARR